jgi:hypothetical protein
MEVQQDEVTRHAQAPRMSAMKNLRKVTRTNAGRPLVTGDEM